MVLDRAHRQTFDEFGFEACCSQVPVAEFLKGVRLLPLISLAAGANLLQFGQFETADRI